MTKKLLITATVQSHICQFHKPLMKMLKETGYEVHVAARDNLAEKNGLQMEYADKVFNVPFDRSPFSLKNINAYKELSKILSSTHYDIIHTNTPMGGMITRLAANKYRKQGTKVFYTAHGFHFYNGAPKKNWLIYYPIEKSMSRLTDKLITINSEDFKLAKNKFHCDVYYVHGVGANSDKFYPMTDVERRAIRKDFGYSESTKLILNVGELLPNKNQKTAILVMEELIKQYPDSKLLIAGNGPELDNLKQLVTDNNLNDFVEFLGYTTEVNKYMNICDCLVACSYREGLPLNVMEALLCGKPVVASNNRGHRELIKDGYNGFIVEPENPDDYSNCVLRLFNDSSFGTNSVESVQLFTDKSVLTELKSIYSI
jgi:glycosyltransferase EpsD